MKTFKGTDSKVIGRKFAGSLVAPVLCTRIVHFFSNDKELHQITKLHE